MRKSKYIIFCGRFQPFHNAHLKIIQVALENAEKVVVAIGSYRCPTSIKNPWTYEERADFIKYSLDKKEVDRVQTIPIRDYIYSDATWISSLQNQISNIVKDDSVQLIGHFKDDSSEYLNFFPQWPLIEQPNYFGIDGTNIRANMFMGKILYDQVPDYVAKSMRRYIETVGFDELRKEFMYIQDYRDKWKTAPFPPTFVTTDAIVVQAGHVLIIKRGVNPGKGRFALPGGFLGQDEPILIGAIRELKEETKIDVPVPTLKKSLKEVQVFDHPKRSLRGRTITHAHFFKLDFHGPLPKIKGGDDATEAFWMPFSDLALNEMNFHEDHLHIIQHFINRS